MMLPDSIPRSDDDDSFSLLDRREHRAFSSSNLGVDSAVVGSVSSQFISHPPSSHARMVSATCLPSMRRLSSSGLGVPSLGAHSLSGPAELLHRRSSEGHSPSPTPTETENTYEVLTDGIDPYDQLEGTIHHIGEVDDDEPMTTTMSEFMDSATRRLQRLGEITCSFLMSFSVLFSLFAEPIRLGFLPRSMDNYFLVGTIIVLALFLIEALIYWSFCYFFPASLHAVGSSTGTSPKSGLTPTSFSRLQASGDTSGVTSTAGTPTSAATLSPRKTEPNTSNIWLMSFDALLKLYGSFAQVLSVFPSSWSLEVVLDYLSIISLVPDILFMSDLISLDRVERDILMVFKAGFLIRLVGMIRCIPIDIFQVWMRMSDRCWWGGHIAEMSKQVVGKLKGIPSPVAQRMERIGLATMALPFYKSKSAQNGDSPDQTRRLVSPAIDSTATSESSVTQPNARSPTPSVSRVLSGSSSSSHSSNGSPFDAASLSLRLSTTPPTASAQVTPPIVAAARAAQLDSSPALMDEHMRLPDLLAGSTSRPSSRASSGTTTSPVLPPFSPKVALHLGLTTQQMAHHRSPLLLNRTLSRDSSFVLPTTNMIPSSTQLNSANKLISLSSMSPLAHRRVISGSSANPNTPSSMAMSQATPGSTLSHLASLALASHMPRTANPSPPRRDLGLHGSSRFAPLLDAASNTSSPRQMPSVPSSRAISLTSMSPIVSGRTMMARQAQRDRDQQHAHHFSPSNGSSNNSTPQSAVSSVSNSPSTSVGTPDSPLSRIRTVGATTPTLSIRTMQPSPVLSSRALTGMAALRDAQRNHLTPPITSNSLAVDSSPSIRTPALSRSACTSPVLRHRKTHTAYNLGDFEPSSASSPSSISPNLFYHELDAYHGGQRMDSPSMHEHLSNASEESPAPTEAPPTITQFSHASHIGQLLSDYTAHRVIIGLLLILFIWHATHPLVLDSRPRFGLERIQHHLPSTVRLHSKMVHSDQIGMGDSGGRPDLTPLTTALIHRYEETWSEQLLFLRVGVDVRVNRTDLIGVLRPEEIHYIRTADCEGWLDIRQYLQSNSRFDLYTMTFLILLLPILLCVIYKDVHTVVTPIERMVSFVTNLARDPLTQLGTMRDATSNLETTIDPTAIVDVTKEMSVIAASSTDEPTFTPVGGRGPNMQSVADGPTMASSFVELTLQKLALLLQVGFGGAGGEIIAQNIIGDHLDPMIPGSRVFAIFGFCDIDDFNKCTETLEESIMLFVNQIAAIVHDSCQHFGGSVNKNIGSGFLLVWKFDPADMKALKYAMQHSSNTRQHRPRNNIITIEPTIPKHMLLKRRPASRPTLNAIIMPSVSSRPETAYGPRNNSLLMHKYRERSASVRGSFLNHGSMWKKADDSDPITSDSLPIDVTDEAANHVESEPIDVPCGESQLTIANLESHDTSHANELAPPSSRPTSRSLMRRLSERSASTATGSTDDGDSLTRPMLLRYATADPTTTTPQTPALTHADPNAIPSFMLPKSAFAAAIPPIGEGELILKQAAPGTPITMLSTATTDTNTSGLSSPRISIFGSSNDSSQLTSQVSSPILSGSASSVSNAMSRLLKLDNELRTSPRDYDVPRIRPPLLGRRRSSLATFLPSPSVIDENETPGTDGNIEGDTNIETKGKEEDNTESTANANRSDTNAVTPRVGDMSAVETKMSGVDDHSGECESHADETSPQSALSSTASTSSAMVSTTLPAGDQPDSSISVTSPMSSQVTPRSTPNTIVMPIRGVARDRSLRVRHEKLDRSTSLSSVASRASTGSGQSTQPTVPMRTAVHRMAHQALSAFLSTVIQIATATTMTRWRTDAHLSARMPAGYDGPSMGFGLHVGWAIEGAIGSSHKIDASYLSPNVNLAARLCSATRQYRIPFLFSGQFYKLLDTNLQKRCRHLDQVLLKGSSQPLDLYTFDISPGWKKAVAGGTGITDLTHAGGVSPIDYAQTRSDWLQRVASINFKLPDRNTPNTGGTVNESETGANTTPAVPSELDDHVTTGDATATVNDATNATSPHTRPPLTPNKAPNADTGSSGVAGDGNAGIIDQLNVLLAQLQCDLPDGYIDLFNRGIKYYISGDWQVAGKYLVKFQTLYREKVALPNVVAATSPDGNTPVPPAPINTVDGPSNVILQFMGKHAFQAPKGWKGYRKLDKK